MKSANKQTDESVRKAYEQTELILSSITSILIGVNQNDLVTHWNSVAEKTFGIPKANVVNRPFADCGIQWDSSPVFAGIADCRKKGRPIRVDDVSFMRTNGQKGLLGLTIIPLSQGAEGYIECILFGADITERKRIEQLKDEFVSTVSHELRTPLTVIREGVSQVLEGILGETNEEQKQFLTLSLEGIDRLVRIVDDLLDISKIEAGKLELRREPVDIASLVKSVGSTFEYQAKERGLEIKLYLPDKHVEVYVDKDKIVQVFTNLISNAFKFTPKGKVEISVADKGREIEYSVSDTGIGISQEDLPKVFGKFEQFSRAVGPGQKGTGLGLAICKGIVELHHGQITVESKLGEGTTFRFNLPKYTAEELFKEHINRGIKEAIKQEASLSIIVFDVSNFDAIKKEIGSDKIIALVRGLEDLIRQNLRRRVTPEGLHRRGSIRGVDVAIRDTRAILVLLPATGKEGALMVAGRIQQTFDDHLSKQKMKEEIKITCRVATFPEDANTAEGLLLKAGG